MKISKLKKQNFNSVVKEAAKAIEKGEVLVCPTDTVYGLICDASDKKAVKKLFKVKKRPEKNPLPIFVKDIKTAKRLAEINSEQEEFLKKVWPGRVTVILKRKEIKTKLYGVDKKTIALRIPDYKVISYLSSVVNSPLTGTSANVSGLPASTKIKEVLNQFKNKRCRPDLVIDAGNLKKARPSTVIDLTAAPPKVLRA